MISAISCNASASTGSQASVEHLFVIKDEETASPTKWWLVRSAQRNYDAASTIPAPFKCVAMVICRLRDTSLHDFTVIRNPIRQCNYMYSSTAIEVKYVHSLYVRCTPNYRINTTVYGSACQHFKSHGPFWRFDWYLWTPLIKPVNTDTYKWSLARECCHPLCAPKIIVSWNLHVTNWHCYTTIEMPTGWNCV